MLPVGYAMLNAIMRQLFLSPEIISYGLFSFGVVGFFPCRHWRAAAAARREKGVDGEPERFRGQRHRNSIRVYAHDIIPKASLPAKLPYQTSFYSLGAVIAFSLTNETDYKSALSSIEQTPLYWALMRCLEPNPKERFLLMI